jgi:hypothetical protein
MATHPRVNVSKSIEVPGANTLGWMPGESTEVNIDVYFDYGNHQVAKEALVLAFKAACGDLDAIAERQSK